MTKPLMTYRQHPVPISYYGQPGVDFDQEVVNQIEMAARLPVAERAALMPDGHKGYALPIGGVIGLRDAVSPAFVGYDIACRVTMSVLDLPPDELMKNRIRIADDMQAVSRFGVGVDFKGKQQRDHAVMDSPLWKQIPVLGQHKALAARQLGTSGGGNHFFDALIGTVVQDTHWMPFTTGTEFVCALTHSGSRGAGNKLAHYYADLARRETSAIAAGIPKGYEWLPLGSGAGQEYWQVMSLMGQYAEANHQLIHDHFLARSGLAQVTRWQNHHNFAFLENDMVIHRKGATPAYAGQIGIIPGTSGTDSYLVEGLGDSDSLWSSSHGAGRATSRTRAKAEFDARAFEEHMRRKAILGWGIARDETFMAYKDIERVMQVQEGRLVRTIARLRPVIVIMGSAADDGD